MLKWLLKSLLVLILLVLASVTLPLASLWLCRDPVGAQVFFWVAPWTCAFWSIITYDLIGSKFWRGPEAVQEWRARRGGYLHSVAKGTAWMFASLAFSFAAELAVVFLVPPNATVMHAFPVFTYSPVLFTILWSARG